MPDYIFDTTALSHFASVNRSDLLETLYRINAFTMLKVMIKKHYRSPVNRLDELI